MEDTHDHEGRNLWSIWRYRHRSRVHIPLKTLFADYFRNLAKVRELRKKIKVQGADIEAVVMTTGISYVAVTFPMAANFQQILDRLRLPKFWKETPHIFMIGPSRNIDRWAGQPWNGIEGRANHSAVIRLIPQGAKDWGGRRLPPKLDKSTCVIQTHSSVADEAVELALRFYAGEKVYTLALDRGHGLATTMEIKADSENQARKAAGMSLHTHGGLQLKDAHRIGNEFRLISISSTFPFA